MTGGARRLGLGAFLALAACGRDSGPGGEARFLDRAAIVSADSEDRMNALLGALHEEADIQIVGISVEDLEGRAIAAYANDLFERWELGSGTRGGRGLLLLIAEREQQVRLEVGYGLEGLFTDAFVGYVEREQMAPWFASGRIGEGIEATVELVAGRAYETILGRAYDPRSEAPATIGGFRSGGAGAQSQVPIATGPAPASPASSGTRDRFAAQPTPRSAWERFLEANRRHVKDPELGIYDARARAFLRDRPMTNAGMDHVARLYDGQAPTIREAGDRAAVVFLDDPDHRLAPWFFHRSVEGWQLDGSMYPSVVAYNHRNQWRFARTDHPYMFAFRDFRLDRHGFAFRR